MNEIRVGVIGIGNFARQHFADVTFLEEMGIAKLEAVVVRHPDKWAELTKEAKARGLRIYADYMDMIEAEKGKLDLISIPTGIDDHSKHAIAAVKAGYHVMCEKPAAGTIDEVLAMRKAQEETGKVMGIGFQNIFSPSIQRIKQIKMNGLLGKLHEARSYASWPRTSTYYNRNDWAGRLKKDGNLVYDSPVQNAVAHYLQNLLYIAGDTMGTSATPISVYGENYHAQPIESADTQFVRVETKEGPICTFAATHATKDQEGPIAEYIFDYGRIAWSSGKEGCQVFLKKGGKEEMIEEFNNGPMNMHMRVFMSTCSAIKKGEQPLSNIHNGWQHIVCVNKLFEASPIHEIPAEFKGMEMRSEAYEGLKKDGENHYINGILNDIREMFKTGKSYSEAGLPWAQKGKTLKVDIT